MSKMNLAEGLAREIKRVTELRAVYKSLEGMPQVMVQPALFMMDEALESASVAAGSNDIAQMLTAFQDLKSFEK
jgi:hypothetical protein